MVGVAGAESRYDQALALQQWFRNGGRFTYSLDAPDTSDRDAVEAFLEDRRGYCVQFASTMALMARALGIPARVAIGFLPGEQVQPNRWQIRANDAHAWPELYFEGVGWVRFEPTPATRTGRPPGVGHTPLRRPGADAVLRRDPGRTAAAGGPGRRGGRRPGGDRDLRLGQDAGRAPPGAAGAGRAGGGGGAALPAAAVAVVRSRRRSRRAKGDDVATALALWRELLERLADRDALPDGRTVREQVADLVRRERLDAQARQALDRLAERCERALYAVEPAPAADGERDLRTVLAAVSARRSRRQRFAATWFPAPAPVTDAPRRGRAVQRVG